MQGACQPLQALCGEGLRRILRGGVCDKGGELSGLRQRRVGGANVIPTIYHAL